MSQHTLGISLPLAFPADITELIPVPMRNQIMATATSTTESKTLRFVPLLFSLLFQPPTWLAAIKNIQAT